MKIDNNHQMFFALARAGLWADRWSVQEFKSSRVPDSVNWHVVYKLAAEQSVQGLVLQGLEWYKEHKPECVASLPQDILFQWIGEVQMIEQQNKSMNDFVAKLIEKLRKEDVYAVLVKGQGIAQCYERPLWRASGDVDLLLDANNYEKAKKTLLPLASDVETEYSHFKHQGMTIDGWVVELHGTFHSRLSMRVDKGIDEVQNDVFSNGSVRSWQNGHSQVFLPSPDNDVIFVFTHILHHFFFEGIGLRQICDWCRLLWTYKDSLNHGLLESRLHKAGLMSEWKAFYNLASKYLGMPDYGSGLMVHDSRYDKKADRIIEFVLETGNFGRNRNIERSNFFFIGKIQAACFKLGDFAHHARIFPLDSVKFYLHYLFDGIRQAYAKKNSQRNNSKN